MCLDNIQEIKKTTEDIIVYKHIEINKLLLRIKNKIVYKSPYQHNIVKFNKILRSIIIIGNYYNNHEYFIIGTKTQIDNNENILDYKNNGIIYSKNKESIKTINNIIGKNSNVSYAFHSYIELKDAKAKAITFNEIVVQCRIPKGSIVITGKFDSLPTIASDRIIYEKILFNYLPKSYKKIYNKIKFK